MTPYTIKDMTRDSKCSLAESRTRRFKKLQRRNRNLHNASIATTSSFLLAVGVAVLSAHSIA